MKKKHIVFISVALTIGVVIFLIIQQILFLRKAHSTFENYFAFRGCIKLVKKTSTYGICTTQSGQTIKIVAFDGKWYLDGDLPWACVGKICFGI